MKAKEVVLGISKRYERVFLGNAPTKLRNIGKG